MSKETAMQKYQDFARSEGREAKKFVDSLIGTKNLNIPKLLSTRNSSTFSIS